MEALHDVVKSGKARYIGASTIFAWQLERMQQIAERNGWTKFVSLQPQYNLIYREEEREILPLCRDRKMAVVPWSPLAGGRCAHPWGTKTARNAIDEVSPMVWGVTDALDKVVVDNLEKIAAAHGRTMARSHRRLDSRSPHRRGGFRARHHAIARRNRCARSSLRPAHQDRRVLILANVRSQVRRC